MAPSNDTLAKAAATLNEMLARCLDDAALAIELKAHEQAEELRRLARVRLQRGRTA